MTPITIHTFHTLLSGWHNYRQRVLRNIHLKYDHNLAGHSGITFHKLRALDAELKESEGDV